MDKEVKKESGDLHPKIVYQPREVKENQIWRFRKLVENKYGLKLNDYWGLYEWSRQNYREFWECLWIFFDIRSSQPYTEVFSKLGSLEDTEWFKGAKLNFAENVLRVRGSRTAIITADENDNVEYVSYDQLYTEVAVYAKALKDLGVTKGDVVTCYMPNKVEAVYAYFATASIGALWCGALPLLGVKAVILRFEQMNPKVLFTTGNFHFDGKETDMTRKLPNIIKNIPSLKKVVFVPSRSKLDKSKNMPGCVPIEDFLRSAREKINKCGANIIFEQVPFSTPLVGWISWNMHISTLYLGLTLVIYDGLPFEETPTRFWDIVDKFGITATSITSSAVDRMQQKKYIPTEKHSLKSLKAIYPIGSVCKPQTFEFLTKDIKPGLFCSSCYGTTEYYGLLGAYDFNLPVYRGEIQCFALGYDLRTVDDKGNYVIGQRGDMLQLNPAPTSPVACLGDDSKKILREIYLSKYPGAWYIGDDVWINPVTKGYIVYGRSDDNMNPKGARFNCSEIYFALDGFPGVIDSVCVSHFNSNLDERVVLFVKMALGHSLTPEVEHSIRKTIEEDLSYEHVPDLIVEAPDVPYNLNGKKLNNLVKRLVNKKAVSNIEVVLNPSSIEFYKNLNLGDF
ncbi:acetoacetyl-CoA synthetase-like [Uloborus diversus]|uniref:acetoacetyl-CoA synthetase-like n=1 Tax=Uloborus diversus TaxID=327109 RepID=UPI002409C635|nr:acetoacetyl-CoA synthetase-like [Uloborus diversus]